MYVCVCLAGHALALLPYHSMYSRVCPSHARTRTSSCTRKVKYMYAFVLVYMDITWVSSHVCFCAGSNMHAVGRAREVLRLDVDISKKHFSRDFR